MSTYRKIHGRSIQAVTTDPTESVAEGQVWYNTTSDTFKSVVSLEAFSSSAPLATTREGAGAFGTQTTAVICGGETPSVSGATEEYDGTGFSAGGTMNTARYRLQGTAGTATAGIVFGGVEPATSNKTETYNGTAWTSSPYTLNTARWCAGAGIQTSALAFGGGPGHKNNSEEFDGEGWTATPTLNTSRNSLSGAGANAEECLAFGGETSTPPAVATNATESWDGTSWTEVNNLNTARYGGYGAGTQSAAFLAGGIVGPGTMQSAAETWDGTNWTSSPASLATARGRLSVAGSSTAAIAMAGQTPSITTATEEYNKSANVITAAAWSSGTALPANRYRLTSFGTATAGVIAGGSTNPPGAQPSTTATLEYDGTTMSSGGALGTARRGLGSAGVLTAGLVFGGSGGASDANVNNESEEYDGSSFSEGNNLNTSRSAICGDGPQTAAFAACGYKGPPGANSNDFEHYDGTSWTNSTSLPSARRWSTGNGPQTASLVTGGETTPSGQITNTEEWNGSGWTAGGAYLSAFSAGASGGTQTAALAFAGRSPSLLSLTAGYDGTAWSTRPSMATARSMVGGTGTISSAFVTGGEISATPPLQTATEEFTGETTAVNVKTLTQS